MNRHYLELVEEARRKKLILVDDCKQELSKLYLRAYKDINNKVFTKDSNIWAMQYRDELKKRTKELNPILYETVKNYAEKSADIGVYPEWALFSKILGDKDHEILNTLTRIPEEVVRELLNGDMYKDNQGLNKRIWRFQKENEQKIDYIIQRGLIEKKSTFELAKDLEMYVNPKAKKTFEWKKVYPNAGNKTIDFNAYRLASTSITHAYQMATIRAAQANPFSEGVKWHSVLSQRTCQLCKDRHGKVFKAEDVPLDHPLGLCTTYSVITKSLKEISEELKKEVYNIDKPMDKGYNNKENISIQYRETDRKAKKSQKRNDIPKTLEKFDRYSKKWENNVVKKYLSEDEIRVIGKEIQGLIDSNDYSMRIDQRFIKNILDDGRFKNQFETNTSGGALNSDIRKKATKQLFGKGSIKNPSDYEKYGYVGHKSFIDDLHESGTSQYGDTIVRFDKDKLRGKVTYTVDDSLGLAYNKLTVAGDADNASANGIRDSKLRFMYDLVTSKDKPTDLTSFLDETGARYIELQYHGEVKADFIKELCFTKDIPDENIIKRLQDKGIRLFRITGDWGSEKIVEI